MLRLRKFMFERVYLGGRRAASTSGSTGRSGRCSTTTWPPRGPAMTSEAVACDYIAGMTDRFAIATFRSVALPEESRL